MRTFVAGHRGLVGSAIFRELVRINPGSPGVDLITADRSTVDLTRKDEVEWFFSVFRPEQVYLCAAKVGGIVANNESPASFILDNLKIQINVMEAAQKYGTRRLLFLGSACAYPKHASNPLREEYLMCGPLEPTNAPYATAKIAGHCMVEAFNRQYGTDFISVIPTNLYGLGDNYSDRNSHVLPGMIRKIHAAKEAGAPSVALWGTGKPVREFLYADDLARACILLMEKYHKSAPVNVGSGEYFPLWVLAYKVAQALDYQGEIEWNSDKPDGTPARWLDSTTIRSLDWVPHTFLNRGLPQVVEDYLNGGGRE